MSQREHKLVGAIKGCVDVLEKVSGMPVRVLTAYGIEPTNVRRQLSRADEAIHWKEEKTNG